MRIIDSHFHWWPRGIFEQLCKRSGYPRAERNSRGGYSYMGHEGRPRSTRGRNGSISTGSSSIWIALAMR